MLSQRIWPAAVSVLSFQGLSSHLHPLFGCIFVFIKCQCASLQGEESALVTGTHELLSLVGGCHFGHMTGEDQQPKVLRTRVKGCITCCMKKNSIISLT